jgi:hypothetical protein
MGALTLRRKLLNLGSIRLESCSTDARDHFVASTPDSVVVSGKSSLKDRGNLSFGE